MAKQNGLFNFEGTLDNVTFYKTADGLFVRKKGGVSRQRILNDASFVRTRENCAEFTNCAKSAALLRKSLAVLVYKAKDNKLSSRLIKLFFAVKQLDSINLRGLRTVGQGLQSPLGKQYLKDFDFNRHARWSSIVSSSYQLDLVTGGVEIASFSPAGQLNCPPGATHFSLQSAFLSIDFGTELSNLTLSPVFNYSALASLVSPILLPSAIPVGGGLKFSLLLCEFFQEVNGVQYPLNNGLFNALTILAVQ